MRHIYLDDLRGCPEGWEIVHTYGACIDALKEGDVGYLSLDHDLGVDHEGKVYGKTGYDVCKWMVENNVWPKISITLHSANPVGRINMRQLLARYCPVPVYG